MSVTVSASTSRLGRAEPLQLSPDRLRRSPARLQIFDGEPGEHRLLGGGVGAAERVCIALLDEEPLLLALLELHQGPHPVELEPSELEQELALGQPSTGSSIGTHRPRSHTITAPAP